ncbi:MAG: FHA domain-containing protein, partial [Chloroflexota bacterium]|nr:FHA domain-containing protein [Chloroflexota bacterium]
LGLSLGGAIGLLVLGGAIGGFIGLVETVLRAAWLKFIRGKLEGQTVTLNSRKQEQILGRADGCEIVIPGDPDVHIQHAAVLREGAAFVIEPRDGPVLVNGPQGYAPVERHTLRHQDRVQLGKTRFIFLSKRKGAAQ